MVRVFPLGLVMILGFLFSAPAQAEVRNVWILVEGRWQSIQLRAGESRQVMVGETFLIEIGDKPPAALVFAVRNGDARMRLLWETDPPGKFAQVYNEVVAGGSGNLSLALNMFTFSTTKNTKVRVEVSIENGHSAVGRFGISY